MRLRLPKPLKGWRHFAGEVGIIVLGVLLALGAQQVAETITQRSQIRELREAVDKEIAFGLGTFDARVVQDQCLHSRLDELGRWLENWREGRSQKLAGPISAPRSAPTHTSVWASRDPSVMAGMPLDVKLAYSSIYDEFANYEVQRLDERITWLELAQFDRAIRLDNASMMRLQGLITRAQWRAGNISDNARLIREMAGRMGIKPRPDPFPTAATEPFCKAILPKA